MMETKSLWRRLAVIATTAAVGIAHYSQAQPGARTESSGLDALVFVGTIGFTGWHTEYTVGNPGGSSVLVVLSFLPNPPACSPFLGCPAGTGLVSVPPNGVNTQPDPGGQPGIGTTYASYDPVNTPIVSGRIRRVDHPEIGVDMPSVKLSTIIAANPSQLVFPGVRQGTAGRSNLVIANVQRVPPPPEGSGDLQLRIDAFSADGTPVGTPLDETVAYGYAKTLFVGQVIAQMGVTELASGLLRVTKTGGGGVMWGVLYSVDAAGSITATVGAYP